ncbi:MAG: GGDEF domain-containing protein [Jannaschia sp.]
MTVLSLESDLLDAIMPLHMLFDGTGRVIGSGPTFDKIAPNATGRRVGDVLRVLQPKLGSDPRRLVEQAGRRLTIQLRHELHVGPRQQWTRMRAVVYDLGAGTGLMNLFFGADVSRGVARHRLSARDFATCDSTVEILFLMEAQAAVMAEFRQQNERLADARTFAETQAVTDTLTGLHNRRAMDRHIQELTQGGVDFGLMHLDLDYFKSVNDTFGHAAGDHVLAIVGQILRDQVRRGDMVARVGGDEFILVFADCADVPMMRRIADRIIARLEEPIFWDGHECRISGSIGITMSTFYRTPQPDRLMSDADAALYASKRDGRSRHSVAPRDGGGAIGESGCGP